MMNTAPAWKSGFLPRQSALTKIDIFRTRMAFKLLALLGFVVFLSLFYIWSRVQIIDAGYKINELKRQGEELKNLNRMLKLELSLMLDPGRIESLAREKLKMVRPEKDRMSVLKSGE